jgi:hypothetical protein
VNRPKTLGYLWESDVASSHIHLDDALGRKLILPAVLCRTPQTFQETIKIIFADHPGFQKVAQMEYEIIDQTDGRAIFQGARFTPHFPREIQPGSKLAMSILSIRTQKAPRDEMVFSLPKEQPCPKCGFDTPGRGLRIW